MQRQDLQDCPGCILNKPGQATEKFSTMLGRQELAEQLSVGFGALARVCALDLHNALCCFLFDAERLLVERSVW